MRRKSYSGGILAEVGPQKALIDAPPVMKLGAISFDQVSRNGIIQNVRIHYALFSVCS